MDYTIELKQNYNAVIFYLDNRFLGVLNHDDGYLSDFRAIVRKGNLSLENNIYDTLRISLFELLNQYLKNHLFFSDEQAQHEKKSIIGANESIIKSFEFTMGEAVVDD